MKNGMDIVRHRVGICGRVLDAGTGKPLRDAEVLITGPESFTKKLEIAALPYGDRWKTMLERLDRTRSKADGLFYFMDLPDGKYSVSASIPSCGKRYGKVEEPAKVSRGADGNAKIPFVRCALPPTHVKGKVTGTGRESGVALARVRVKGSGELSFTDAQGQYTVAGIEPGKRTLLVSAQGYRAESQEFTLGGAGASKTLEDFKLTHENG
ncbi:MAG: carboxypeptidase regulatory-like domain-containing protein [Candidatus Sulfotelmatobacter sp.]